jgi:hypothetical protein
MQLPLTVLLLVPAPAGGLVVVIEDFQKLLHARELHKLPDTRRALCTPIDFTERSRGFYWCR